MPVLMKKEERLDEVVLHLCRVERVETLELRACHRLRGEDYGLVRVLEEEIGVRKQDLRRHEIVKEGCFTFFQHVVE